MRDSKYSIKNYYYSLLSEMEDHNHVSPDVVNGISNVDFSKDDDYLKIGFNTSYGKDMDYVCKYGDFKNWFKDNAHKNQDVFGSFLSEALSSLTEVDEGGINEIVDDNGDIMADEDKPNNSTNSMVGSSVWDLERVYKSSIPKSVRFYSGDLGMGVITW